MSDQPDINDVVHMTRWEHGECDCWLVMTERRGPRAYGSVFLGEQPWEGNADEVKDLYAGTDMWQHVPVDQLPEDVLAALVKWRLSQ
jgi:hypothetical protein